MISLLKGTIEHVGKDAIVLMTDGGVGYEVVVRRSGSDVREGDVVTMYTYLKVSENAMELYGFQTMQERAFFQLLLGVSGVGPKSAMNVLALGSIAEIQTAIAREDVQYLTAVQGMGKKTAERMVVELKSKISTSDSGLQTSVDGQTLSEVIDGLVAMGYGKEEAKAVVKGLDAKGKTTEELLRLALQKK